MKKFIVAFDGLRFSESVRDYAVMLARQSGAHLVGVFLEDLLSTAIKSTISLQKTAIMRAGKGSWRKKTGSKETWPSKVLKPHANKQV